jgi:hypothetical protein
MSNSEARFTVDGPDEVEARIGVDQQRVASAVRAIVPQGALVALVLAGGYGRGEGGYRRSGEHAVPYNDYDYFLVVDGLGRSALALLRRRLHELGEALGPEFGLEVDFAVFESRRLRRLPACLMYSELKWRQRTLLGDPDALSALRSPPVLDLPLAEFSRMMLNRGALLLMNSEALASGAVTAADARERFLRYISKGVLAAGDARLAAERSYHPSTYERARRVRDWCAQDRSRDGFAELYAVAVRIKQGGAVDLPADPTTLANLQQRAVDAWLDAFRALESARLGHDVADWGAYSAAAVPKGQGGTGLRRAWHVLLALRGGTGRAVRAGLSRLLRHPRERIIAALPLLLATDPRPGLRAARPLGLPSGTGRHALIEAFFADWRRYC